MTEHEEKAKKLVEKYENILIEEGLFRVVRKRLSKQCALKTVDEMQSEYKELESSLNPKNEEAYNYVKSFINDSIEYWEKVKKAIEGM